MLVEVILDLFVGYVDTQLLKGVGLEILKAKDVKYSYAENLTSETSDIR